MAAKPSPSLGGHIVEEFLGNGNVRSQRIALHLEQLLASTPFKTSKRCQALLSYVVLEKLADRADRLKERTIGVDVFGREPSYDTNHDAVVRNAAAEVRKRLAQFYVEHESGVRIELPLGSYIPFFLDPVVERSPTPEPAALPPGPSRTVLIKALAVLALAILLALIGWRFSTQASVHALDRFWAPVLQEREAVHLCVGQPIKLYTFAGARASELHQLMAANAPGTVALSEMEKVPERYLWLGDAEAMLKVTSLLQKHGKAYVARVGSQTNYVDLRGSPAVLLGAFNNDWTLSLTSDLRFYFSNNREAHMKAIVDRDHRDDRRWQAADGIPRIKVFEDYALVTRLLDPGTERTVISIAGITDMGTLAAAEFLTDASYLENAFRNAPSNWSTKNIQVVLKTHIVGGAPGPPSVEATYLW